MDRAIAGLKSPVRPPDGDESLTFAVEVVQKAEALGFDATLVAERYMGPDLEAWMLASALAARTTAIELIVAVHPGVLAPQLTAKMGASLDRISNGRFAMNVVNGWWESEFNNFSNGQWLESSDARYRRMGEFMEIAHRLWAGETFSYDGEFFVLDEGCVPTRPIGGIPPIYTASRTESGLEMVARYADVWFVTFDPDFRRAEENLKLIEKDIASMRQRAAKHGRSVRIGMSCHALIADSAEEAERRAVALVERGQGDRLTATFAKGLGAGLIGTPEVIADQLRRYETIGMDLVMLNFQPMSEGLSQFGETVLPLVERSSRPARSNGSATS